MHSAGEKREEKVSNVAVRVRSERYVEAEDPATKRSVVVVSPWQNNFVRHNGRKFGPNDQFEVPVSTAHRLIAGGSVQLASEEPEPFWPPSIDHSIQMSHGIVQREAVLGMIPTRQGSEDQTAPWIPMEDEGYDDEE